MQVAPQYMTQQLVLEETGFYLQGSNFGWEAGITSVQSPVLP